jgi:hypothetical protein
MFLTSFPESNSILIAINLHTKKHQVAELSEITQSKMKSNASINATKNDKDRAVETSGPSRIMSNWTYGSCEVCPNLNNVAGVWADGVTPSSSETSGDCTT